MDAVDGPDILSRFVVGDLDDLLDLDEVKLLDENSLPVGVTFRSTELQCLW